MTFDAFKIGIILLQNFGINLVACKLGGGRDGLNRMGGEYVSMRYRIRNFSFTLRRGMKDRLDSIKKRNVNVRSWIRDLTLTLNKKVGEEGRDDLNNTGIGNIGERSRI